MKLDLLLFILFIVTCSSSPNPIVSHSDQKKVDTIIKVDTVFDYLIYHDTTFHIDTLVQIDTISEKVPNLVYNKQISKCEMNVEYLKKNTVYEGQLKISGFVLTQDVKLMKGYKLEYIKVNDDVIKINDISNNGYISFSLNRVFYSMPNRFKIIIVTSVGKIIGSVNTPNKEHISPYFYNLKLKDGERYITTDDSLGMVWNETSDDLFNISYDYLGQNIRTGDSIKMIVDTVVTGSGVMFNNSYFPHFAEGEIINLSISGVTGVIYGSEKTNMFGDGVGWLSCKNSEILSVGSVIKVYNSFHNDQDIKTY